VIDGPGLSNAERWLAEQRKIWEAQADRLEEFVMREQEEDANDADRDR